MVTSGASSQGTHRYLQEVGLFQGLSDAELTAVARAGRHRQAKSDAFFFHQGEPATTLYVLTRGRVRLAQVTPEGQQLILRFIGPGNMFGGIAALGEKIYPAAAQAVDDCEALAWNGETMRRLMERYPRIALNALELLAERIQAVQDRYRELATERVERRIARALLRLVQQTGRRVEAGVLIDMPLSRHDLAEMTGTTLYTVSRTLSRWEGEGLVETGRQRVLIRNPHSLVAIAEDLPSGSSLD